MKRHPDAGPAVHVLRLLFISAHCLESRCDLRETGHCSENLADVGDHAEPELASGSLLVDGKHGGIEKYPAARDRFVRGFVELQLELVDQVQFEWELAKDGAAIAAAPLMNNA